MPTWWPFALLAAAGFRTWKLAADDVLLNRPRAWLLGLGEWQSGPAPPGYRQRLADFVTCPWCLGFWLTAGWWAGWLLWPDGALVVAVPFALSTAVGFLAEFK